MTSIEARLKQLEESLLELQGKYEVSQRRNRPEDTSRERDPYISSNDKDTDEPISRARVVLSKLDPHSGNRREFDESSSLSLDTSDSKNARRYAFTLRKFINPDNDPGDSEIEIYGDELRKLLKRLLQHYPYHYFLGDELTIPSPFQILVFNWDLLQREASLQGKDEEDQIARNDLQLLLETIKQGSGEAKLDDYFRLRDSLKSSKAITFENLWTIFPPGTLVYSRIFLKHDQIFIVEDNERTWPRESSRSRETISWSINCWTYDWNGRCFQRRGIQLSIESFEGSRPILSLPVHPVDEMEDFGAIKLKLIDRGRKFRTYCTIPKDSRMFQYEGKAYFDKRGFRGVNNGIDQDSVIDYDEILYRRRRTLGSPPSESATSEKKSSMVSSEIIIDFESYYKHGFAISRIANLQLSDETEECRCFECKGREALTKLYMTNYDGKTGAPEEKWEDTQYMLCAPRVLGYVLRDKQWAQLDVECIKEIGRQKENSAFWDKLKLMGEAGGREVKDLLHGLVKNHGIIENVDRSSGYQLDDIVAEKGKGLIILLYGPPGVGKTSTAQTIARAAGKPLFSIGVADVGTTAKHVESNLENIFDLATAWKAVLLIDEADVFLQSRARGQMGPTTERNALVSVFLRVLEYYQGIMILTTNQIAQFDIAVQSRIHIAIKYQSLDKEQTIDIFRGFLDQYRKRDLVSLDSYEDITNWVKRDLYKKKFDGRQIRNIVTSAMGLACANSRTMTLDDLTRVVSIVQEFKGDLEFQMRQYEEAQNGNQNPYR